MKRFFSALLALVLLLCFGLAALAATSASYRYDSTFKTKTLAKYTAFADVYSPGLSFALPGLTRTDFPGSYCTAMTPQGICFVEDYIVLSAYDEIDDYAKQSKTAPHAAHESVLYILSNADVSARKLVAVVILPAKPHAGGLAFDGTKLWIASTDQGVARVRWADIREPLSKRGDARIQIRLSSAQYQSVKLVDQRASFCSYALDALWVGDYRTDGTATLTAYALTQEGEDVPVLTQRFRCKLPNYVQGAVPTRDERGDMLYLSRSSGRAGSVAELRICTLSVDTNTYAWQRSLALPPMSEDLAVQDGVLYINFESAATGYSTIAGNKCLYPTDRVCAIELRALRRATADAWTSILSPTADSWNRLLSVFRELLTQITAQQKK
ncbi:MAG: hypothetical protein LBN05_05985 [Oscillospiraceae bacterium]|nr:hypothetical protein [Oscillospiraceae bacterium]